MGVIFAVRGTSLDAYYARFAKKPGLVYGGGSIIPAVTASADPNMFGGSYIAKANGTGVMRGIIYPGFANTPESTAFAILIRFIPRWASGIPTIAQALFSIAGYSSGGLNKIEAYLNSNGKLVFRTTDTTQSTGTITFNSTNTFSGWVQNQVHDVMISWDGTNSANSFKWSVDGVEIDAFTPSISAYAVQPGVRTGISVGMVADTNHSNWDLNELVLFNNAQGHVYSPRTGFWSVSNYSGFPETTDVRSGTTFTSTESYSTKTGTVVVPVSTNVRSGVSVDNSSSGSLHVPSESEVKTGTTFDDGIRTGTYDGSDRWSDPGESVVLNGVQYKANSTTNNKTGLLQSASVEDVAAAVWDRPLNEHIVSGTFGNFMQKLLTISKFLGLK
jgi:hypothetical protein